MEIDAKVLQLIILAPIILILFSLVMGFISAKYDKEYE